MLFGNVLASSFIQSYQNDFPKWRKFPKWLPMYKKPEHPVRKAKTQIEQLTLSEVMFPQSSCKSNIGRQFKMADQSSIFIITWRVCNIFSKSLLYLNGWVFYKNKFLKIFKMAAHIENFNLRRHPTFQMTEKIDFCHLFAQELHLTLL
jgi:hypothetical protein